MNAKRAVLELENMKHRFEDNIGGKTLIWPDSNDIEALDIAIEALNEQIKREDDRK